MIELANGSMQGAYVIMQSKYKSIGILGIYPKLVVWPKDKDFYFVRWMNAHKDSLRTNITFDNTTDAWNWIHQH